MQGGKEVVIDVSEEIVKAIKGMNLDAVVVIGGDGTLRIAMDLFGKGVPVIGVPKTIDNDVGGTEVTFGFDTALMIAHRSAGPAAYHCRSASSRHGTGTDGAGCRLYCPALRASPAGRM